MNVFPSAAGHTALGVIAVDELEGADVEEDAERLGEAEEPVKALYPEDGELTIEVMELEILLAGVIPVMPKLGRELDVVEDTDTEVGRPVAVPKVGVAVEPPDRLIIPLPERLVDVVPVGEKRFEFDTVLPVD